LLGRSENAKSNDREQQEAERILKATDYITKGQIESYKIQINAGIRGIEILESFIKNLEEVKNDVATITPETVTKVTGILYSKVRGIYDGIAKKVKAIEEAYDKQIEAIEQKQQKLEGKK
jgi:hypothetical protein